METIVAKIDVTKIEKARLFKGEKGTYLDVVLIPRENDQYGNDFMVVQSVTKEEREKGVKGPILGNAKFLRKRGEQAQGPQQAPAARSAPDDTDVPF